METIFYKTSLFYDKIQSPNYDKIISLFFDKTHSLKNEKGDSKMTHFERTYMLGREPKIAISYADGKHRNSDANDIVRAFNKQKQEMEMQLEYRELDRLSMELEK